MKVEREILLTDSLDNITRLSKGNDGLYLQQGKDTPLYVPLSEVNEFLREIKAFVAG